MAPAAGCRLFSVVSERARKFVATPRSTRIASTSELCELVGNITSPCVALHFWNVAQVMPYSRQTPPASRQYVALANPNDLRFRKPIRLHVHPLKGVEPRPFLKEVAGMQLSTGDCNPSLGLVANG